MKKFILIFSVILFNIQLIYCQQWIDKKYEYENLQNLSYGASVNFNGKIDTLQMDIFLPECNDESLRRPLLMWIHGGAFLAGDKNDPSIQTMCKEFAKRGYVTASIDYRLGFISDELAWECNYPNYECLFATDSSEWSRAYYRAVQDAKGALRFLINRHEQYRIDTSNVFVAGESAGAFTAMGVGLLDTILERPVHSYDLENVPLPNSNALGCIYNGGEIFDGDSIARPDLGGIDGDIEPTNIQFTIKGIGNMYGAMMSDLLANIPANKIKPAIYSFHQPCDIIVPIDSNYVNWGLSWCFTNGYNCYGINNNEIMLYGSRAFSNWNSNNGYGYIIQDEFTTLEFPFSFLFGQGSCADQIENPCHAYDNRVLRENNLAIFFADKITTSPICDTTTVTEVQDLSLEDLKVYPNPTKNILQINGSQVVALESIHLFDVLGVKVSIVPVFNGNDISIEMSNLKNGLYILQLRNIDKTSRIIKIIKN